MKGKRVVKDFTGLWSSVSVASAIKLLILLDRRYLGLIGRFRECETAFIVFGFQMFLLPLTA